MGKVIINGKTYDALTGLKIDDKQPEIPVSRAADILEPAAEISVKKSPEKRGSKQKRLADAIAREFADEERRLENSPKNEQRMHAEKANSRANAPAWISNYVEGHEPIEIEPIQVKPPAKLEDKTEELSPTRREIQRQKPSNYNRNRARKSQILNRNFVKKPTSAFQPNVARRPVKLAVKHPDVHRFAPLKINVSESMPPKPVAPKSVRELADAPFVPVISHKTAKNIIEKKAVKRPAPSSVELKDILINSQLEQPVDNRSRSRAEKAAAKFGVKRRFRRTSLVTAALAVMVLGGYFTYANMPALSVRVAANQAGIDARSPYAPNGYSIDGPVAYSPGRVTIQYKANGGAPGYSVTEQNADTSANEAIGNDQYQTIEAGNVTIYQSGHTAAWVSNGVLYTLKGNHLLSADQISRIAESV